MNNNYMDIEVMYTMILTIDNSNTNNILFQNDLDEFIFV